MASNTWSSFINNCFYFDLIDHFKGNELLIKAILGLKPTSVLDVGCGCGLTSIALAQKGLKVSCLDKNSEVLSQVHKLSVFYGVDLKLYQCDVTKKLPLSGHFNVAFSQGLLEHFSDFEVSFILQNISFISDYLIIEVPSEKWPKASSSISSFGDERFLNRKQWLRLFKSSDIDVIYSYGWGLLPKYRKLNYFLPNLFAKSFSSIYGNNLGFICKRRLASCE